MNKRHQASGEKIITLWNRGLGKPAIAKRMGISWTAVQHRLKFFRTKGIPLRDEVPSLIPYDWDRLKEVGRKTLRRMK